MAYCWCGKLVVQLTAWTYANCGCRFYGCLDLKCEFFTWIDFPLCHRARSIMPGLIRKINILQEENKLLEEKLSKKGSCSPVLFILIVTWVLILFYIFQK